MEPKVSMSWFAVAEIIGLIMLALGGHALAGLWAGAGVAALAAFLHATYLFQRRAAAHMPERFRSRRQHGLVPRHRRKLDRWALGQWLGVGLIGGAGSALIHQPGWRPFHAVGFVFNVLIIGWVVLWAGIYLSSVVDWFLIMPKVSGVVCPAPCERPGHQRWAGITALWLFHRGFARLLVPVVLIGCPTVIGALTSSAGGRAICFSLSATLALYLAEFELQGKAAISYALNPRRYIGDTLWLVRESHDSVERLPAFLMDVSAEGGKFKYLDSDGRYAAGEFAQKHDDDGRPVTLTELNDRPRIDAAIAPYSDACTGINWYCWRNPLAHSQTAGGGELDND
jgi:hypothetical protein